MRAISTSRFNHLLIAALVTLVSSPALAVTITGRASVIDGDTLEIHGQRIRLSGVDAPESDQHDSLQYRCGAKVANELDRFIAGKPVSCKGVDVDRYRRVVAVCSVGRQDIGEWIVRSGLALDWPRYSKESLPALRTKPSARVAVSGLVVTLYRGTTGLADGAADGRAGARMRFARCIKRF